MWNAPLITYGFDHLIHDAGVSHFLVNTHHAADRYDQVFPGKKYRDCPIEFCFEKVLLDTAGGIDHIRDRLPKDEDFIVYNGDILTDLPLGPAIEAHRESGDLVTLILRPNRGNVAWDPDTRRVTDMRNLRETNATILFQFTGIYMVAPEFLSYLKPGKIESVVFAFLRAVEDGWKVGGCLIEKGAWTDLGDPDSYRSALRLMTRARVSLIRPAVRKMPDSSPGEDSSNRSDRCHFVDRARSVDRTRSRGHRVGDLAGGADRRGRKGGKVGGFGTGKSQVTKDELRCQMRQKNGRKKDELVSVAASASEWSFIGLSLERF